MLDYVWLIPTLPMLAALWTGLAGRRLGEKAGLIAVGGIFSALIVTLCLLVEMVQYRAAGIDPFPHVVHLFTWMEVAGYTVDFAFLLDELSMVMLVVVTLLGTLIFYYAQGYMHGDPGYPRFFTYMSLFAFAMLLLVLGDNFLLMFIGWEGVGLCSYLLIGYYFKEGWCADAGRKAFIVNRIGDFGFLLAAFFIFWTFGTFEFLGVNEGAAHLAEEGGLGVQGLFFAISFCLLVAATGKSAQIPLYVWLPDAMAGPTPVSALIHAATMVTAGVYMITRANVLFVLSPMTMQIVAIVGAATALVAALIAVTQTDIKKVLAYSTVSQLGYMFLALGMGAFAAAMFHVFTHAFFKGCLFLCAGSVIHALHHEQDMRNMGGLRRKMPITATTYLISTIAIAGIPPLSGFFSKDEILWVTAGQGHYILWGIGALTAFLTAFYMFRSYFMTFEGEPRADEHAMEHAHESPRTMTIPLIALAFGATVAGVLGILPWMSEVAGFHWLHGKTLLFKEFLAPVAERGNHLLEELGRRPYHPHFEDHNWQFFLEVSFALISVILAAFGLLAAWLLFNRKDSAAGDAKVSRLPGYALAQALFYVDQVYQAIVVRPMKTAAVYCTVFDRDAIDGSIRGVIVWLREGAMALRRMQSGLIQAYAVAFMVGLIIFLLFGF